MNQKNKDCMEADRERLNSFYHEQYFQIGFGIKQNIYFMEEIIKHLPRTIVDYLNTNEAEVLDYGCAMGFGTRILLNHFPRIKLYGLEIIKYVVDCAQAINPDVNFILNEDGIVENSYDIIITSHCIEHYLEPLDIVKDLLEKTRKYLIILVPYAEIPLCIDHRSYFLETTFPVQLAGFSLYDMVVYDANRAFLGVDKMIQVVYQKDTGDHGVQPRQP